MSFAGGEWVLLCVALGCIALLAVEVAALLTCRGFYPKAWKRFNDSADAPPNAMLLGIVLVIGALLFGLTAVG